MTKNMTGKLLAGAALLLGLLSSASAQNQYTNWLYSGSINVLTTPAGANLAASVSETNFPVLVRLNADLFNFGQAKSDGSDIRFASTNGTPLAYEIEQWDSVNRRAAVWVLIPNIKGNATQPVNLYWGNPSATNQSNGRSVFNSTNGYCAVMHMNGNVLDATGSTSPVNNGATPTTAVIGSTALNLGSGGISVANITNFPTGNNPASTSEIWLRARSVNQWSQIMGWGNANAYGWNTWIMQIGFWNSMGGLPRLPSPLTCYGPGGVSGVTPIVAQQWYHVVYTSSNGTGKIYINGVLDATATGGSQTITDPQAMSLSAGNVGGDSDVDEARISRVARSADWIKLEYENQNALQTLVGCLVPAGTNFSVSPTSVTMSENSTTNVTGQAGGAQKIYWVRKQNGQETVVAVDQLSLPLTTGRVTGNQSYVIQFKAVYANGSVQTNDVPVTVLDTIPDPAFTLATSTNLWDGRQTMTVTANLSNLAAMQAAGATNLSYTWNVAGVAVTKLITNGTLTLLRSQGSGPMPVTLVMHNGGALITNSVTVTVQEPATDAWVIRTPGATEKAVNNQFYARDDTGMGTVFYNGTLGGSPSSVYLKVYTNGVLYTNLSQTLSGGAYAFTARIAAGLVAYKVVFGSVTGATTNVLDTVTNVVCGDAYILEGQSNAVALDGLPDETSTSPWIRTYGWNGVGWGSAIRKGTDWWIGYWGMDLATNLVATYNIPICIINGAVGGTRIDQHQPNPANHFIADSYGNMIYANLLTRVAGAKLTHGIRAILWHQGENNSGAAAPTGDYDFKSYEQYFVDMSAAWKQDYPNVLHYDIFQVYPNPCSMGGTFASDSLREVQRTLPRLFSKMSILSTIGLPGYIGCHYTAAGYTQIATVVGPLVKQDNYGLLPTQPVTAPNLKQAWFTTTNRTQIALEFDQNIAWNSAATVNFYLDRIGGKVTSGSASNNVITLQVTGATTNLTIAYVVDQYWNGSSANLLYGSNGISALTFYAVPLAASASTSVALNNLPATGITTSAAVLNTTLSCSGTNATVSAYWNTVNGGTSAALWTNSVYLGAWTNMVATNLSYNVTGLSPAMTYYFTFRGTNTTSDLWAANVQSFTTLPLPAPIVDNATGATNVSVGVAQLRGTLANGPSDVRFFWGTTDGGTNKANWANVISLTGTPTGSFTSNASNLTYGVTYYYRSYASNQWGTAWAAATTNFTTLRPASSLTNASATGITISTAALKATLICTGAVYQVSAYWNTVSGGTNTALWTNSAFVGAFTNVSGSNLSFTATGLAPNTTCYFTFRATNALDSLWATNVQSFTTLTPPGPTVDNAAGATNTVVSVAALWGTLATGPADVRLYWGTSDGGTNKASWGNTILLSGTASGAFSGNASGLIYGRTYFYRAYASNQWGAAWAPAPASFTSLKPLGASAGVIPYTSMVEVSASEETSGYEVMNVFNGNGMLGDGSTHTASGEWLSVGNQPVASQWVKVRFDQTYSLDYLRVWAFAESPDLCVTNADVYVVNQASDPGNNLHLAGGPFNTTGWTQVLPQQVFTSSPGGNITNTDPHISLGGMLARQVAFKINATVTDLGLAGLSEIQIYRFAPTPITLSNAAATSLTANSAGLNGTLASAGAAYDVFACWNTVNGGTNVALWTNTAFVGSCSDVASTNLSYTAPGLAASTTYYFTFRAMNAVETLWATNVLSFTTLAAGAPTPTLTGFTGPVTGQFTFVGTSSGAGNIVTLMATNLTTPIVWKPIQTNSVSAGAFNISIPQGAWVQAFYRLMGQ